MDKDTLLRKLYITKKSRINMEDRLKKRLFLLKYTLTVFSIAIITFSLFNLYVSDADFNVAIIMFSIIVFMIGIAINYKDYYFKINNIKRDYVKMGKLWSTLNKMDANEKFDHIEDEYNEILMDSDNHSEFDYWRAIYNDLDEKETLRTFEKVMVLFYTRVYVYAVFLIVPIVPITLYFLIF